MIVNPPMAKGRGEMLPPTGFSNFSREYEELLLQTKFLAVDSFHGHLSKKKFQIGPIVLVLKLDKGRALGGWQPLSH